VLQVTAEAENGSFTLLPRHVDFVAALVPGILFYIKEDEQEEFLAVDEGVLVKCGQDVRVSVIAAVWGKKLGELRDMIMSVPECQRARAPRAMRSTSWKWILIRRLMELG
jgi:F-type H+-transporting ATPase subunit epsilon